jgi:tryptophanyl-tRNA synthetase
VINSSRRGVADINGQDDDELGQIYANYTKGTMLTSEIKKKCADVIAAYVTDFQARRGKVTDTILDDFMKPRPLLVRGQLSNTVVPAVGGGGAKKNLAVADPNSKSQAKKAEKMRLPEAKKAQKAREKEEKAKAAANVAPSTDDAKGSAPAASADK